MEELNTLFGPAGPAAAAAAAPPLVLPPVELAEGERTCPACGKAIRIEALLCRFCNTTLDPALRRQQELEAEEKAKKDKLRTYVRQSSFGWLIVAVIQFVFSTYLSAAWGVICLVLGAIGLAFPVRAMLCVNGCAMMLIGLANLFGSLAGSGGPGVMTYLGGMQIFWGFKELKKFASGDVTENK